ncbi:MAG: hypothetical protein HYV37_02755 [Candidatus Levyibacteriota bacterium]|nr:MAG: hypothetical protein HYV37_02755 [Candidatus Levybacteria bacterium]
MDIIGSFKQKKETSISHVLFDKSGKRLQDFPLVKCAPGENVFCTQREHPVTYLLSMLARILTEIFIFTAFFLVVTNTLNFTSLFANKQTLLLIATIAGMATILLIELYTFLSWYYQFYIVTNKSIVHKRFFRISGFYSEVIFLEQIHQQEIDRSPSNLLYDYLRIENVTVRFHKLERDEPFFFKTPENAQEIEDAIQSITIEAGSHNKV